MTLCKHRPQRTYDEQYILEQNDVNGLLKKMDEAAALMGEDGLRSTSYYVGAYIAFKTLFGDARANGEVDKWTDFMASFDAALQKLEGGEAWE